MGVGGCGLVCVEFVGCASRVGFRMIAAGFGIGHLFADWCWGLLWLLLRLC